MLTSYDFIIVGSGIAGLHAALALAPHGKVLIVTKSTLDAASTQYAQGGIAAVTDPEDSVEAHHKETIVVGYGHNDYAAVNHLVHGGKKAVQRLQSYGLQFARRRFLEAGHSYPRILHATDFTGREIEKTLIKEIRKHKSITVWEDTFAVDLLIEKNQCIGIVVIKDNQCLTLTCRATVLASGGTGQLYQWTTNPSVATGDGIAMAARAGASIVDMEFIQFHPTALQENHSPLFLLSETLRGEGAYLVDQQRKRFMPAIHPDAELAPRDVVARTIFSQQKSGTVYLDMRHKQKKMLIERFPNIYQGLLDRGYDLATELIPVTPAAHFLCGGIKTDIFGRTSIKNLFAYGETAATGVHGANRLASNSLLEGAVFPEQIIACLDGLPKIIPTSPSNTFHYTATKQYQLLKPLVQKIMWEYVGIVRTQSGLTRAKKKLDTLRKKIVITDEKNEKTQEVINMIETARLITMAAQRRKKSLGTHYITAN